LDTLLLIEQKTGIQMNLIFNAKNLSELCALLDDNDAGDVFVYKASYGGIDDPEMHRLKNQYIDARKDILNYLNDESVMDTPLNDARDAKHGWDGIKTVRDIALICQNEGFEYGLLHKSGFLGVDDPIVHKLINDYASKHYELLKYLAVDFLYTKRSVFTPMN
jgi:hypothetical protein